MQSMQNYTRSVIAILLGLIVAAEGAFAASSGDVKPVYNTDIAIIGGGAAGLSAAVEAASAGAKVIVLEKTSVLGGCLFFSEGLFAVESHLQKEMGYNYSKDDVFNEIEAYHHWRNNVRMTRVFVDRSAENIEWLEKKIGIQFRGIGLSAMATEENRDKDDPLLKSYYWHMFQKPGASAAPMVAAAKKAGVQFLLETPATSLIMKNGTCVGVEAQNKKTGKVVVHARAVIIATGGAGNDANIIKDYTQVDGKTICYPTTNHDGDGLKMAWAAGADHGLMGIFIMGPWIKEMGESYANDLNVIGFQPLLWVNKCGIRYTNEDTIIPLQNAGLTFANQPDQSNFIVFDQKTLDMMSNTHLDLGLRDWPNDATPLATLPESIKKGAEHKRVVSGNTLEALAKNASKVMGIDGKALVATINEYNEMCKVGKDSWFNKRVEYMRPVTEAPFYIVKNDNAHLGTLGGIRINEKTEVLHVDDQKVISGLYAAGMDSSGIFGENYDFSVSGEATAYAIISGRIAGETAAAYVK